MVKFLKRLGLYEFSQKLAILFFGKRQKLAGKYIRGNGLEIGALNYPLGVPKKGVKVTYIDRMDNKLLRKHYPELDPSEFVKIGIIDDGEKLVTVKSNSQDFVVANHFIEHCENPIKTLINHLRVLKNGGVIFWAVPNKDRTFDREREKTTFSHIWKDYKIGPKYFRKRHYEEWVRYVLNTPQNRIQERVLRLMRDKYSIHFHVWTPESFRLFLNLVRKKLKLNFKVEDLVVSLNEFIVIIRKNNG